MKIKHYPGKAVANDPYLLDIDARNPAMDLLYQASWLDAQRSLSNSSSGSNSWDRHSNSSSEKNPLKLLKYNTLQNEKKEKNGSVRSRKYHSDQYLSRIAPQRTKIKVIDMDSSVDDYQTYYLPSQTKNRQNSFKELKTDLTLENQIEPSVKYKNVINDLEVQLVKKSVRFDDKSEEIGVQDYIESTNSERSHESAERNSQFEKIENGDSSKQKRNSIQKVRVHENPLASYNIYKSTSVNLTDNQISVNVDRERKDSEEIINERVNEWINEQNQYIVGNSRSISNSPHVTNSKITVQQCEINDYPYIPPRTNYKPHPAQRNIKTNEFKQNTDQEEYLKETDEEVNGIYISRIKPQNQTDEEFYEQLVNSRQRLPAEKNGFTKPETKKIYDEESVTQRESKIHYDNERLSPGKNSYTKPESIKAIYHENGKRFSIEKNSFTKSESKRTTYNENEQRLPPQKNTFNPESKIPHYENEDVIANCAKEILENCSDLYKNNVKNSAIYPESQNSDFLIPRPKLIVPVHTYAVRKRRTGNLQSRKSLTESVRLEPMSHDLNDGLNGEIFLFVLLESSLCILSNEDITLKRPIT